jgi:plastocyanin
MSRRVSDRASGDRVSAGGRRMTLVLSALLAAAVTAPAATATAPEGHRQGDAPRSSHRGRCASRAHRLGRGRRRCTHRQAATKAPVPALALSAPVGPTIQPLAPSAAPPPAPAPPAPAPATPGPASQGMEPGVGGGEVGEGVEPPSVPHVQVSAVEYAFTLSRTTVPAGKVIFQFVNNGQDEHNLKIALGEGPLAGSFANTPSKGISDLQLEIQPGEYTLFCSLPTHEQKGMKATLTVE